MSRKLLIEQITPSNLNYINESGTRSNGKRYIGRLEGPAATFVKPTRNNRKYPLKLWRNVENSEEFKEGMLTHTIFGEADHPDDRLETKISKVAICLDKFEIRESDGIVWCAFDILDTPEGRTVKSILDYGSILGVSSRGSGDEITDEFGECIIDPDTYIFICFDVVILPAVKTARPTRVESLSRVNLCESLIKQINESKTSDELVLIKDVIDSQKIPVNDSVKESLNKRLSEFKSGDDVSNELISELESATLQIERLTKINESLKSKVSAGESRLSESLRIINEMKVNSKKFKQVIKSKNQEISELCESIQENVNQYSDYDSEINSLNERIKRLKSINHSLTEQVGSMKTDINHLIGTNSELRVQLESMKKNGSKTRSLLESKINELSDKHSDKDDKLRKLTESSKRSQLLYENLQKQNLAIFKQYRRVICSMNGLNESDSRITSCKSIEQLNETVKSIINENDRFNRLPIDLDMDTQFIKVIKESSNHTASDEEIQTMEILNGVHK